MQDDVKRRAGPYEGDGKTKSFPFSFYVFSADDVKVVTSVKDSVAETTLEKDVDFSVTVNADQSATPGGTVVLANALASTHALSILSNLAYTQEMQLTNFSRFPPEIVNSAMDRTVILIQQLKEQVERTLTVPATSAQTPEQLLNAILETAATANEYAELAKQVHVDVVGRYGEIVDIRDHVDEQAAKVDGAIGAIEEARDEAVDVVEAEGDKIKNEVGGLVDNAAAIAQSVASSVSTVNAAVVSASQSATQAINAQNQASQSEQIATQAAQDAAQSAQNAGFAFRFSGSAQANGTYLIQSLTPSINTKVGDHVVSGSGQVFRIVSVTDTSFTLSGVLTSFVGPEGQRGPQGESIVGPEGPRGPQGVPGLQGETGSGLEIRDTFDSESQLPSVGSSGDAYFVGSDLFVWSPSQGAWVNKGQIGGGGGITGLMSPDPREYFLYILGESGSDAPDIPDVPDTPDEPEVDSSYSPKLDTGKLDYLVLA